MHVRQLRPEGNRSLHLSRSSFGISGFCSTEAEQQDVSRRQLRPGRCERRVEADRSLELGFSGMKDGWRDVPRTFFLAAKIGIVSVEVLRRPQRQLPAGAVGQGHVERAGDLACDVGLHLEHIGQGRIESLLPLCRGHRPRSDPDQFRADPHPAGAVRRLVPADSRREQVLSPQLARDLLRRLARVPVLVGTRSGDDGEARDLGQLTPDLVAHPVGEVCVGGVAQVLEREHGYALHPPALVVATGMTPAPGEQHAEADEEAEDQRRRHHWHPPSRADDRSGRCDCAGGGFGGQPNGRRGR